MKKFKILFFCVMMLFVISSWAQDYQIFRNPDKGTNRSAELQCPPGSVFSQVPSWVSASMTFIAPREFADDFTTASAPLSMRFWGMNIDWDNWAFCTPAEMTFIIRFYERNPSDPALPGALAATYTLTAVPQYGYISYGDDFQIDLTFPEPVPVTDGWVSLSCTTDSSPCYTLCHAEDMWGTGLGNACIYMQNWDTGEWYWQPAVPDELELSMAFCLNGPVPPVPITSWALVIGFVLIGTFIIIRYRRA